MIGTEITILTPIPAKAIDLNPRLHDLLAKSANETITPAEDRELGRLIYENSEQEH